MKKWAFTVIVAASLVAAACLAVPSTKAAAVQLSAQQMAQITGGYKHCADEDCGEYAQGCANGSMVISSGATGRRCWGTTATYCSSSGQTLCATYLGECNSDCTVCKSNEPCMTDSGCYSCN